MIKKSTISTLCAIAIAAIGVTTTARADIIFFEGNDPQDDENVLITPNDDPADTVEGELNQSGGIVLFTSDAGQLIGPSSGQARVEAADGSLTQITFATPGGTFTSAIFNPNSGEGDATVTVTEDNGQTSQHTYALGNGNNFLTITAIDGQRIASVSISVEDGGFDDLRQVRLGGFEPTEGVPDGGLTLILLGLSLSGLTAARRYLAA